MNGFRQTWHQLFTAKSPLAWAWLVIICILGAALIRVKPWSERNIIRQDVLQYYSYLPAVLVHQDVSMSYSNGNYYYHDKVWGQVKRPGLGPVQKYTAGMAVMLAPGFLTAMAHAKLGGFTVDGYTRPFRFWMQISVLMYVLVGLYFLQKVLLRFASPHAVALTLVGVALATNLLYYTIAEPGMPHGSLFMLVSMLMWFTQQFYTHPTWRNSTILAVIASLICLIRPNHLILLGIPVLYGLASVQDVRARLQFLKGNALKVLTWPVIGLLLGSVQLIYWKHLTGHWLYYSYGDEGFFFGNPALLDVLFSFRKGFLVYTPIMALGIAGLIFVWRRAKEWALATTLVTLLTYYIIAAWWCWWYGGCFGLRAFIDIFPLLAVGMAVLYDRIQVAEKKGIRMAMMGVVAFFVALNIFQSAQYHKGILHYDSMNAKAYMAILGRWGQVAEFEHLYTAPDYEAAMRGE